MRAEKVRSELEAPIFQGTLLVDFLLLEGSICA